MISLLANIDVDDLARAERFYCGALGLAVGRRLGASVVELLGASSPVCLIEFRGRGYDEIAERGA